MRQLQTIRARAAALTAEERLPLLIACGGVSALVYAAYVALYPLWVWASFKVDFPRLDPGHVPMVTVPMMWALLFAIYLGAYSLVPRLPARRWVVIVAGFSLLFAALLV